MLQNAIQSLAENYDKPLSEYLKYKEIVEENKDDPHIYTYIKEHFRPINLKIGSNGAYLWGCDQNYYGDVNQACSALCNGGISYKQNSQTCQYQIWTYTSSLCLKENTSSPNAYIYVDKDWSGFTQEDIQLLQENGVDFVSILKTENSKHEVVSSMLKIDELPVIKKEEIVQIKETSYTIYYILLFLFLIILGICAYLFSDKIIY